MHSKKCKSPYLDCFFIVKSFKNKDKTLNRLYLSHDREIHLLQQLKMQQVQEKESNKYT